MRRTVLLVVAGVVVLALVVLGFSAWWFNRTPPALAEGQGLARVSMPDFTGGRHVSAEPTAVVDRTPVRCTLLDVADGAASMTIEVGGQPGKSAPEATRDVHGARRGDTVTVGSRTVEIVHVWDMPGRPHDAVDVRVS